MNLGLVCGLILQAQTAFIKVGQPQVNLSLLAIAHPVRLDGESLKSPIDKDLVRVLEKDLSVVGLFRLLPRSDHLDKTPSLKPKTQEPQGFDWETWKSQGVDYLLKTGYRVTQGKVQLEVYFYSVNLQKGLWLQRYETNADNWRSMVHQAMDDIVHVITGKRSFLTKKIAFLASPAGATHRELFIADWDGENRKQLTNLKTLLVSPNWSLDGKKIVFTGFLKKGLQRNADCLIYDLESGQLKKVSSRPGINSGAVFVSPTELLVTLSTESSPDIFRMDQNGQILARITNGPLGAMNVEPAVSPDGKWLAFSSDRAGRPMIYISQIDGTNLRRLTYAGTYNAAPAWFPDSSRLAFAAWMEKAFDIYTIDVTGQNLQRITKAYKSNGRQASHENPHVSPDGRVIIYTSNIKGPTHIHISLTDGSQSWAITEDNWSYFQPRFQP